MNVNAQLGGPFKRNQISFSPFRLVDIINPGLELGYERSDGKRLASDFSVALLYDFLHTTQWSDFIGFRVSVEQKYYIYKRSNTSRDYISVGLVFAKTQFNAVQQFGVTSPEQDTVIRDPHFVVHYKDTILVDKHTAAFNIKYGIQLRPKKSKHLYMDASIGVGLKFKDVYHFDKVNKGDVMDNTKIFDRNYLAVVNGRYFSLNVPINIKIGYMF